MTTTSDGSPIRSLSNQQAVRLKESDCRLEDFLPVVEQTTDLSTYPHASDVRSNVLVYDSGAVRAAVGTAEGVDEMAAELVRG